LVGYAAYDVVRYFERLPARAAGASGVPALHYVAPRSVLVFDHLTRGIALLHAGSEQERRSLRQEVVRALRGALPNGRRRGRYAPPTTAYARAEYMAGVRRTQEYIAAGDVYQLVLASRFGRHARSLRAESVLERGELHERRHRRVEDHRLCRRVIATLQDSKCAPDNKKPIPGSSGDGFSGAVGNL